jgi:glycine dehydrogenase subunit 1
MPYFFNTPDDRQTMLAAIGAGSVDELFAAIPAELRLARPLDISPAMCEMELTRHVSALAAKNSGAGKKACFLGGGSYDHFVPAAVDAICSRGEFYTSYTPYQPEVSQGNLQAMFEYQTLVCQLTGLDVSNASLYDGGSAAVEGVLLCMGITKRERKVVVAESVHPEYRHIVRTYLADRGTELVTVPAPGGVIAAADLQKAVDGETACVLVQHPNFFGCLEDVRTAASIAHDKGALLVQSFDPISLGLLKRPGDLGADVAVAEGQSLGSPMSYGGPYLGIMACREAFVRRMPGRIAGQTVDRRGNRCTSAAKRPPATSAPTRGCTRCGPACISRSWGHRVCAKWRSFARRKRITPQSGSPAAQPRARRVRAVASSFRLPPRSSRSLSYATSAAKSSGC